MGIVASKEEYNIEELVGNLDFQSGQFQDIGNGIFLTNREIEILKRYKIPYTQCKSLKEIIFEVEEVLQDMDIDLLQHLQQHLKYDNYIQLLHVDTKELLL